MTKYIVEIPRIDPSLPWYTLEVFESQTDAVNYADHKLGSNNGWYNMMKYDGKYHTVTTPSPDSLTSSDNQYLEIEAFHHKSDCLEFIQANFNATNEGNIYLISES